MVFDSFFLRGPLSQQKQNEIRSRAGVLGKYFVLTYFAVLANMIYYLREIDFAGAPTFFYVIAVYLTYGFIYLTPIFLPILLLNRVVSWNFCDSLTGRFPIAKKAIPYSAILIGFTLLQLFIFVDHNLYRLYGFHFNGFVWNLIFTRGGLESMGGSRSTSISYALIVFFLAAIQTGLFFAASRVEFIHRAFVKVFTRRFIAVAAILIILLGLAERVTYGFCHVLSYRPVLAASHAFLFYTPMTFRRFALSMGFKPAKDQGFRLKSNTKSLHYPLKPIERKPAGKHYNIVWLTAESLRADMVDPEIMPATTAFARKSSWFKNHYSGGNGTRMALFAMFYGLYGNYWFKFLEENRSPLLIDLLLQDNYQIHARTSAKFTYPEFDRTIWARVAPENLHESKQNKEGWENDRENVTQMLDFIDKRDTNRPFMTFMFFESPHARYYFPPESVIRKPYLEDVNYATMDLKRDISLIKNRYINSCYHLDSQHQRIFEYLESHQLLESTIVLIAGDHGEEFMEKGRWGHGSTFVEEQIRTPLILWVPGKPPAEITNLTSHLDIPATLLPLLGAANPPEDYSLGFDLLGPVKREFTVLSEWNEVAYVSPGYKAVFPPRRRAFYGTNRDNAR